jgi:hypothetical protein
MGLKETSAARDGSIRRGIVRAGLERTHTGSLKIFRMIDQPLMVVFDGQYLAGLRILGDVIVEFREPCPRPGGPRELRRPQLPPSQERSVGTNACATVFRFAVRVEHP